MKQQFVSHPVDLGHGYSVEFRFAPGGLFCEWTPDVPTASDWPLIEERYRQARDWFIGAQLYRFVGKAGPVTTEVRP